jgi:hypothetical protein
MRNSDWRGDGRNDIRAMKMAAEKMAFARRPVRADEGTGGARQSFPNIGLENYSSLVALYRRILVCA